MFIQDSFERNGQTAYSSVVNKVCTANMIKQVLLRVLLTT